MNTIVIESEERKKEREREREREGEGERERKGGRKDDNAGGDEKHKSA